MSARGLGDPVERVDVHLPNFAEMVTGPLGAARPDLELVVHDTPESLIAALPEVDVLYAFRTPRDHWAEATNLRMIQVGAAGVDSVLPAEGLRPETIVCNAPNIHTPQMQEFVLAMLLGLGRDIPAMVRRQDRREWKLFPPKVLHGARLVVVGAGSIGTDIARLARAIGMRVDGVNRSGRPVEGFDTVVPIDRMDDVLDGADAVVLVVPLTAETRGLFGAAQFARMAPGSLFVDVSRGGVADLSALADALDRRHLRAAAVDVFETEPLPDDDPLWSVPRLLVTPHVAGFTVDFVERATAIMVDNLADLEAGRQPATAVDRSLGY